MKLHLPKQLAAALLATFTPALFFTLSASATDEDLHLYILTGQSNAQGAIYHTELPQATLEAYSSDAILWDGNISGYRSNPPTMSVTNPEWGAMQMQYIDYSGGNTMNLMGPEYGFSYMTQRLQEKGVLTGGGQLGVVKTTLNGGGNGYWKEGAATYTAMVKSMQDAILAAAQSGQYSNISVDGLLYLQGESNGADGASAGTEYKKMVADLSDKLTTWVAEQKAAGTIGNNVTVQFADNTVMGRPSQDASGTIASQMAAAQTTQADGSVLTNTDGNGIGYIQTTDLGRASSSTIHFDGEAQLTIGARYAYAFAVQNGADVGAVRGSDATAALDSAAAWWMEKMPDSDAVITWDVSSVSGAATNYAAATTVANNANTIQGSLSVGGIKVEDAYRGEVFIRGGQLDVGASGITLEKGNLTISSATTTTAAQNWNLAGGRKLTIGTDSAAAAINHDIALTNTDNTAAANVIVNGQSKDWALNGNINLSVGAAEAVRLAEGSSVSLTLTQTGSALNALELGANTDFYVNGKGTGALSIGTLTLGGDTTVHLDFAGTTRYDSLSLGSMGGSGSVTLDFNITNSGRGGEFVVVSGWNSSTAFTAGGLGDKGTLALRDGNLVLTLSGGTMQDYTKAWPEGTQTSAAMVSGGTTDASASGTNTLSTGSTSYFYGVGTSRGTTDAPLNQYAEVQTSTSATWISAVGSGQSSNPTNLVGDSSVKVTGSAATSGTKVYNAVNAHVTGNVYMELDNPNAAYIEINGAHNADISGSNTLVVQGGTVTGDVTMGSVSGNKTIGGGTYLQIDDGTFKGNIYGGSKVAATVDGGAHITINGGTFTGMVTAGSNGDKTGSVINEGAELIINDGTFSNYVVAGGFAGTINGGVKLTISGGDFSAMDSGKGIYAGGGSGNTVITGGTLTTLQDIAEGNSFAAYQGVLSGGNQAPKASLSGSKQLVLSNVTTKLNAALQAFDSLQVTDASDATLRSPKISGAGISSVSIEGNSALTIDTEGNRWESGWNIAVEEGSSFTKTGDKWMNTGVATGAGTIAVSSGGLLVADASAFTGALQVAENASLQVNKAGAGTTYDVAQGATATLAAAAGNLGTAKGAGLIQFSGTGTNTSALSFAEDWTGTVALSGNSMGVSGNDVILDLNAFGQKGSTVQLSGVGTGVGRYCYVGGSFSYDANLNLVKNAAGNPALKMNARAKDTMVFKGDISGDGGFTYEYNANTYTTFKFLGNLEDYSGEMSFTKSNILFGEGDVAPTLSGNNGSCTGTGSIMGVNNSSVVINYMTEVHADSTFSGSLSLTTKAQGLTLTAANDYTGTTRVESGYLKLTGEGTTGTGIVTLVHDDALVNHYIAFGDAATLTTNGADATLANHTAVTASGISGTEERHAVISNALLTVTGDFSLSFVDLVNTTLHMQHTGDTAVEADGKLTNTAVINTGSNALVLSNAANTLTQITAQSAAVIVTEAEASAASLTSVSAVGGDVTLSGLAAGSSLHLDTLNIEAGQSVSVYFGTPTAEEIQGAQSGLSGGIESSITVSSTFSAGAGAQLNADLVMADGSTLNLSGSVSMGSSVQLGEDMSLVLTLDPGVDAETELIALFTGVEGPVTLGALSDAHNVWLSAADVFSSVTINGVTADPNNYCVGVWGDSILFASATTAPEPATATLSLLALAALAARRKRK